MKIIPPGNPDNTLTNNPDQEPLISWEDFQQVRLCAGTIISVEDFPEARKPAYKLTVDFGPDVGIKKSSAQITGLYDKDSLLNKQAIAVVNFPKKQISPFMAECLVTGFYRDSGDVVLAVWDKPVKNGQMPG